MLRPCHNCAQPTHLYLFCSRCRSLKSRVEARASRKTYYSDYYQRNRDKKKAAATKAMARSRTRPITCFGIYQKGAEIRHLPFELTFDEFMTFWQRPCDYCGSDIPTVGIDRVDSSRGYTMNNTVPCCSNCNKMKLSLPVGTFLKHCARVVRHYALNT